MEDLSSVFRRMAFRPESLPDNEAAQIAQPIPAPVLAARPDAEKAEPSLLVFASAPKRRNQIIEMAEQVSLFDMLSA